MQVWCGQNMPIKLHDRKEAYQMLWYLTVRVGGIHEHSPVSAQLGYSSGIIVKTGASYGSGRSMLGWKILTQLT